MSFYPPKISQRFHRASRAGKIADAEAVGAGASLICGVFVRFYLQIEVESKRIHTAKFQTNGCGYAVAAADVLAETVEGKRINQIHELDVNSLQTAIETALGDFPETRNHCQSLALDALRQAFADFRRRQIEEFTGEKALICTCFGVSEETIEKVIELRAAETVEDVTEACGAGGGCGACQPLIEDILEIHLRERF